MNSNLRKQIISARPNDVQKKTSSISGVPSEKIRPHVHLDTESNTSVERLKWVLREKWLEWARTGSIQHIRTR